MSESSSNVQTVRRAFERWNAGDHTPPLEDVDPQIEIHSAIASAFKGEPFRGYEGIREWLATLDESFERWDVEIHQIRERGEIVVMLGVLHARGRGSGLELDLPTASVVEFRGGRAIRLRVFQDVDEALAFAGLGRR